MKCSQALEMLFADRDGMDPLDTKRATDHVAGCSDCQLAADALNVLCNERSSDSPAPSPGAVDRAIDYAIRFAPIVAAAPDRGFLRGMLIGAAAAAGIAAAVFMLPKGGTDPAGATPQIAMSTDETRDISISLESVTALDDAEIHVVLIGSLGLQGYGEQRELRWRTDLDAGVNQLTLPVIALGSDGGQVFVEVFHADRERRFLVDIDGAG